ncbi:hypothetical protein Efla_007560 [Eimeria flavescens]
MSPGCRTWVNCFLILHHICTLVNASLELNVTPRFAANASSRCNASVWLPEDSSSRDSVRSSFMRLLSACKQLNLKAATHLRDSEDSSDQSSVPTDKSPSRQKTEEGGAAWINRQGQQKNNKDSLFPCESENAQIDISKETSAASSVDQINRQQSKQLSEWLHDERYLPPNSLPVVLRSSEQPRLTNATDIMRDVQEPRRFARIVESAWTKVAAALLAADSPWEHAQRVTCWYTRPALMQLLLLLVDSSSSCLSCYRTSLCISAICCCLVDSALNKRNEDNAVALFCVLDKALQSLHPNCYSEACRSTKWKVTFDEMIQHVGRQALHFSSPILQAAAANSAATAAALASVETDRTLCVGLHGRACSWSVQRKEAA